LAYQGQPNNFNWGKNNGKLTKAAANNVFAILWGGGNTTNVIKNFSNPDDHGWLAGKIINYYLNPVRLTPALALTHDFNGDGKSDIGWRDGSGDLGLWLMNGATVLSSGSIGGVSAAWSMVGQRDFNGDGMADLLWRDSSGDTSIWFMNGTTVASSASVGNIPTTWTVVGVADFNGDGMGDLLWRDSSGDMAV
jgi:FG-GAP-like repeat